jgi:hypothetical protein
MAKAEAEIFYGLFYGRAKILMQNCAIRRNAARI